MSRPLTEAKHYRRNVGRLVALTLADGQVTGRIEASDADGVDLDVDGHTRRVAYTDISKAVVQAELRKDAGDDEEE